MERQRSFSFKPTRPLFFSFTVSSSLLLCFLFYFWALSNTPPTPHQTHFQYTSFLEAKDVRSFLHLGSNSSGSGGSIDVLAGSGFMEMSESAGKVLGSVQERKSADSSSDSQFAVSVDSKREDFILRDTHLRDSANSSQEAADLDLETTETSSDDTGEIDVIPEIPAFHGNNGSESDVFKGKNETFGDRRTVDIDSGDTHNASETNLALGMGEIEEERLGACDISTGEWVFDESYPLYTNETCPFIDEGFRCQSNGRPDRDYMKWRWQPNDCNFPRFNAVKMLELIRGKRLLFVGDSINRNQWESLLCMLRRGLADPRRVYEARGRKITKEKGNYSFKFVDYHSSVEYYVTHFLVHESKARVGKKRVLTLRIDTIDRSASKWRGADILVFNTAHWWSHDKTKAGKNYYQEGDQVHPHLDVSTAFKRAMLTWASWVDGHITPGKTQVFFRSSAPSHFRGGEWNSGGHCKESTQPLHETTTAISPEKNLIIEQVVKQMKTPVTFLNITRLSGLRIDGHPSVYGKSPSRGLPFSVQDCSHWCLPGVPDTWNELLYFLLLSKQESVSAN